jgi:hypothetical protein
VVSAVEVVIPDAMGVWSEDGEVWLPREHYPKRSDAIRWAVDQWVCRWIDVRCLSRWMRYEPLLARNFDGEVVWEEDRWFECARDFPGAFPVWRLETA